VVTVLRRRIDAVPLALLRTPRPLTAPLVVVIARPELAQVLRRSLACDTPVAFFCPSDYPLAFESILERPPKMLVLDADFTRTSRAAALVARVKSDPALTAVELRILAYDETDLPILLNEPAASFEAAVTKVSQPLDGCGTRRTLRLRMRGWVLAVVNGTPSELVNVSVTGAQILVPERLQPRQQVRVTLTDERTELRLHGVIIWSTLELSGRAASYRVGVQFADTDPHALTAFCSRHGPDRADVLSEAGQEALGPTGGHGELRHEPKPVTDIASRPRRAQRRVRAEGRPPLGALAASTFPVPFANARSGNRIARSCMPYGRARDDGEHAASDCRTCITHDPAANPGRHAKHLQVLSESAVRTALGWFAWKR